MINISVLGSTGSIGTQTLEIVDNNDDLNIVALSANTNVEKILKQCIKYKPAIVGMMNEESANELSKRLEKYFDKGEIKVVFGMNGLIEVATIKCDIVITAIVGMIGLEPTVAAIKKGNDIGLANKETLVCAGEIIMPLAKEYGVKIYPVDSEHSAIYQSIGKENYKNIESIILTASGGPFRGKKLEELENIKKEDALKHPNWDMGAKITIDSSTLMNKGLEMIEAKWLFEVETENINIVVHKESILHSAVTFVDGAVIGQMGLPDMKLPIQYAIYKTNRKFMPYERLDLTKIMSLTFEKPDTKSFRCLELAKKAIKIGKELPTVMNQANEVCVRLYLEDKIGYLEIAKLIEETMNEYMKNEYNIKEKLSIKSILKARDWTNKYLAKY